MKVVLATESFAPNISGVAVATEILATNLKKAGHEVYVFCPDTKLPEEKYLKYDFNVVKLPSFTNPFRKGFRITTLQRAEIEEKIKRIRPDLIHLQDVASIGNAIRDIGNKLKIPVIITNHFSLEFALSYVKFKPFKPIFKFFLKRYLAWFYDKCNLVITPTETIAKQVRSWGTKTKVIAASNGIFFNRFSKRLPEKIINDFKEKYHIPENPIVLYAGRMDKDKSIDVLVKAIPTVVKETNAHFVFAGSGDLIDEMKQLVDKENIRNNVTFLGRLDYKSDEFVALYQSGTVFAIASTIETQSLVTLEAMSSGLPIVAVKYNALPEIVKEDENGLLFKPGDSKKLASNIITILSNKEMIEKMSKRSIEIASEHEISKAFNHMLTIYNEILLAKRITK